MNEELNLGSIGFSFWRAEQALRAPLWDVIWQGFVRMEVVGLAAVSTAQAAGGPQVKHLQSSVTSEQRMWPVARRAATGGGGPDVQGLMLDSQPFGGKCCQQKGDR